MVQMQEDVIVAIRDRRTVNGNGRPEKIVLWRPVVNGREFEAAADHPVAVNGV